MPAVRNFDPFFPIDLAYDPQAVTYNVTSLAYEPHLSVFASTKLLASEENAEVSFLGKRKASKMHPPKAKRLLFKSDGADGDVANDAAELVMQTMQAKSRSVEQAHQPNVEEILTQLADIPDEALTAAEGEPEVDTCSVVAKPQAVETTEHSNSKSMACREVNATASNVSWLLNYLDEKLLDEEVKARSLDVGRLSTVTAAPRSSRWTKGEIRALWKSIATFGNDWVTIASMCKRRTYVQVKDKARRCLLSKGWKTGKTKAETKIGCLRAKEIANSVLTTSAASKV